MCALSCGGTKKEAVTPKKAMELQLSRSLGLPKSSELVVRLHVGRLRESALFTALLSLLSVEGALKGYAHVEKTCGASPAKVVDEIALARGAFGWVAITRARMSEDTLLACSEKLLGGTRSRRGVRGESLRMQLEGDTVAIGTSAGVQAATEAAPEDAPQVVLGEKTVLAVAGDVADMTIDASVDASPAMVKAHARIRFPTAEQASQIYERVSKARASALETSERSLAKDVLKSIHLDIRGASLDVELGIDGDIPVQQRYLDVLLGIYEAVRKSER